MEYSYFKQWLDSLEQFNSNSTQSSTGEPFSTDDGYTHTYVTQAHTISVIINHPNSDTGSGHTKSIDASNSRAQSHQCHSLTDNSHHVLVSSKKKDPRRREVWMLT